MDAEASSQGRVYSGLSLNTTAFKLAGYKSLTSVR